MVDHEWEILEGIGRNRAVVSGVVIAILCGVGGAIYRGCSLTSPRRLPETAVRFQHVLSWLCALTVAWIGTFEICRAFRFETSLQRWFSQPAASASVMVTLFWALQAGVMWAIARREWPSIMNCAFLLIIAAILKVGIFDTAIAASSGDWNLLHGVASNRSFIVGCCVIALGFWSAWSASRTSTASATYFCKPENVRGLLLGVLLLVTWIPTFEILRVFRFETWASERFTHPLDARGVFITAYWTVNALVLWIIGSPKRVLPATYAMILTLLAVVRLVVLDTSEQASSGKWSQLEGIGTNRTFLVGSLLIGTCFLGLYRIRKLIAKSAADIYKSALGTFWVVLVGLLIIWLPTFEIARVFRHETLRDRFTDPLLAMHVVLSLFWATTATIYIVIGFLRNLPALRYVALCLYLLTLVKVVFFDMSQLETIYRIISFMGLGILLLIASALYQKLASRIGETVMPEQSGSH